MKATYLGLCLSLLAGTAMAQSAPQPMAPPTDGTGGAMTPPPGQAPAPHARPQQGEPYQGEVVETPYGTYVMGPPGEEDEAGGPDEPGGPQGMGAGPGPRPHPHGPMHPRESKAAHFRMKSGDTGLDIKCPDDEAVKACVDAVLPLLDRIAPQHH